MENEIFMCNEVDCPNRGIPFRSIQALNGHIGRVHSNRARRRGVRRRFVRTTNDLNPQRRRHNEQEQNDFEVPAPHVEPENEEQNEEPPNELHFEVVNDDNNVEQNVEPLIPVIPPRIDPNEPIPPPLHSETIISVNTVAAHGFVGTVTTTSTVNITTRRNENFMDEIQEQNTESQTTMARRIRVVTDANGNRVRVPYDDELNIPYVPYAGLMTDMQVHIANHDAALRTAAEQMEEQRDQIPSPAPSDISSDSDSALSTPATSDDEE